MFIDSNQAKIVLWGIISYVMTWNGIVTKYHKTYVKRLEIPMNVEAYIQSIVLKKTVETIFFVRQKGLESEQNGTESWEKTSMGVIMRTEMHKEPTPPLKQARTDENINEELDLEEETTVVKKVEENAQKS
ncbi:hypothetical protein CWI38_0368p0030 [Hamiltosporidium tvaerminnensis]|uniref:Uncharacterized protein n=1 Tax=Hamiltosporidium tvaerminnensis TaxID=1176355 RepID=A0A4Q9LXW5_9MICR|nr:hypothetical protein CWI38_0368p0030 [Hamiltosporidium tvaerminnensis]